MVLPDWQTGVTLSCCYHSTTLPLLGRGIPRERARTCQENLPRVQRWCWTTLQLGLGLKKQHCLRNDWTAFAWGWNGITVSKLALSSNGLPGESVLTLTNKLIEFETCYWATHTLSRGTARVTCTAILVEFWKSHNATWNARTAQGGSPPGSSFFCLFHFSLTAFITQQIQI